MKHNMIYSYHLVRYYKHSMIEVQQMLMITENVRYFDTALYNHNIITINCQFYIKVKPTGYYSTHTCIYLGPLSLKDINKMKPSKA
jgi:hypothetical protein